MNRNEVIAEIKAALKRRSGKQWSVTGGRGTAYGWITISSMPARRDQFDRMSAEDIAELAKLLDKPTIHQQGESIPAGSDYYQEYIDRANGRKPSRIGVPYWD